MINGEAENIDAEKSAAALRARIEQLEGELARARAEARDFKAFLNRELRTGLSSILGFAQLLQMEGNKAERESVEEIIKSGRQLMKFIETEVGPPMADRARTSAEDGQSPYAETGSADTVLYIEDNEANFALVRHILRGRANTELLRAARGAAGIILARERRPRLILLDLNLPDIHGSEVLRQLQTEKETAAIPVVVISADATASQIERLLAAGARNYLTKPFSIEEFLAVVDELLSQQVAFT